VPSLVNLNPETCYLSFDMALASTASREEVEGAFSFVADDCELDVIAPETEEQKLVRAIEEMPATPRLGDMLVSVGAVSQEKLTEVLSTQGQSKHANAAQKPKLGNLLETQAGVPPEVVEAALNKQQKSRETSGGEENRYIRVQADRLDAVINLLGELVIAGAGANLLARETRNVALIEANLHMNGSDRGDPQRHAGSAHGAGGRNLQPLSPRVVRDTASSLGKEVNFEIVGGEAELDKSMVEKIADPLMHLVRNSLDHGLEPPQERVAAGKSAGWQAGAQRAARDRCHPDPHRGRRSGHQSRAGAAARLEPRPD
jgi:two-component system chemotaxis sensor kinase CheA